MSLSKDQVSSSYIDRQKQKHLLGLPHNSPVILITGDAKKNSIGEAIRIRRYACCDIVAPFDGDVRSREDRQRAFGTNWTGHSFNTLICCHGVNHMDWIEHMQSEHIAEQISVNLTATIQMVSEFVRSTIDNRERKTIILIGSMGGKAVLNGSSAYCASKAGLEHFSRCAAWELAPKGYDVFHINPSNVQDAPMSEETIKGLMRYRGLSREDAERYWGAVCPKDHFLTVGEIADLVDFLLSGKAEYLSGCAIDLKGGQR